MTLMTITTDSVKQTYIRRSSWHCCRFDTDDLALLSCSYTSMHKSLYGICYHSLPLSAVLCVDVGSQKSITNAPLHLCLPCWTRFANVRIYHVRICALSVGIKAPVSGHGDYRDAGCYCQPNRQDQHFSPWVFPPSRADEIYAVRAWHVRLLCVCVSSAVCSPVWQCYWWMAAKERPDKSLGANKSLILNRKWSQMCHRWHGGGDPGLAAEPCLHCHSSAAEHATKWERLIWGHRLVQDHPAAHYNAQAL